MALPPIQHDALRLGQQYEDDPSLYRPALDAWEGMAGDEHAASTTHNGR
jgi:hypothetical protein